MANQTNSLAHTEGVRGYHITLSPKYRRQIVYNQYRADMGGIIGTLCKDKGVEMVMARFPSAMQARTAKKGRRGSQGLFWK